MRKGVFKYSLKIEAEQVIQLPLGAEPLCVQTQHNVPFLWALGDLDALPTNVKIVTFGTGHKVPSDMDLKYLGTYQLYSGDYLVFHSFVVLN